jgi:phage protein U
MAQEYPVFALGRFEFSTRAACFAEFQRQSEYSWAAQSRIGTDPALQFTGYSVESLTLPIIAVTDEAMDAVDGLRMAADTAAYAAYWP